jgi:ABC-type Fe3+-hydroxamate transport system substrate-binding protein
MHYQIEYYNKLWRDWLAFDQLFYQTEEQAQKIIDAYKQNIPEIKTRIIQTNILNEKLRRTRSKNLARKVSVEKA